MKHLSIALVGALLAVGATPALAASEITIPVASTAPSTDPGSDETTFDPAAIAQLSWDSTTSKAAAESTTARITTDGKFLYVRFDAAQNERVASAQPVNGKSDGDLVWIDLWPAGANGALYRYAASPDGSGSATTSTGAAAPAMQSSGTTFPGGYTVTMKIPLAALRGVQGGGAWNVQLARSIHATGQQLVWSHEGDTATADDLASAGTMTLPSVAAAATP